MTQVWVALMTYLILAFLRFKAGLGISFQQLVRLLQINLFERRKRIELCNPPSPHVGGTQLLWAV
jgi:putative transposase